LQGERWSTDDAKDSERSPESKAKMPMELVKARRGWGCVSCPGAQVHGAEPTFLAASGMGRRIPACVIRKNRPIEALALSAFHMCNIWESGCVWHDRLRERGRGTFAAALQRLRDDEHPSMDREETSSALIRVRGGIRGELHRNAQVSQTRELLFSKLFSNLTQRFGSHKSNQSFVVALKNEQVKRPTGERPVRG